MQIVDMSANKGLLRNRRFLAAWQKIFSAIPMFRDFFAQRLVWMFMAPPKGFLCVPTQVGVDMVINPHEGGIVEQSIYRNGVYESGLIDFVQEHLKQGDSFVDIGANVGFISMCASQCVGEEGKVFSFEPVDTTAALLRKSIEVNGIKNTELFGVGLSNASGEAPIFKPDAVNRGAVSLAGTTAKEQLPEQVVTLKRLDEVLSPEQWQKVSLVKIDVEGWELEVLQGATGLIEKTGHTPVFIVEYDGDRKERARALYEYLASWPDSKIYKKRYSKRCAGGLVPVRSSSDLPHVDNLFVFPKSYQI